MPIDIKKSKMGTVVKDFYKSDAPQFKGKSKKKRREMAIAAKLSAEDTAQEGYFGEKYGDTFDTTKYKERRKKEEKSHKEKNLRMKHGKKWKQFTKDVVAAKERERNRLRPGEVKKLVDGEWVSNKN